MSQQQYIGNRISLISKLDIRYEGILACVDSQDATIALAKVRSFGTEDRSCIQAVPPQDKIYEYIIFKASDIKDLIVCEPNQPQNIAGLTYDPAILSVTQQPIEAQEERNENEQDSNEGNKLQAAKISQPQQRNNSKPVQQKEQQQNFSNNRKLNQFNSSTEQFNREKNYQQNIQQQLRNNYRQRQYNNEIENVLVGGYKNEQQGAYRQSNQNYYRGGHNTNNNTQRVPYNSNQSNNYSRNNHQQQITRGQMSHRDQRFKFDSDFDFEKANEKFQEQLSDVEKLLSNANLERATDNENKNADSHSNESGNFSSVSNNDLFYNKSTSFFDNISCEAIEKEEGTNTRPDWKKERQTNQETFGHSAVRSLTYRRGPRLSFLNNRPTALQNMPRHQQRNQQQHYEEGNNGPRFQLQQRQYASNNRRGGTNTIINANQ